MITLVKKIPAAYENAVLERYYKFYQFLNCERDILNKNLRFTMDESKLTDKELYNKSFMDSRKTIKNENYNFSFLLSFDCEERLVAVTRIYITKTRVNVCDMVYLNYPDIAEKLMLLNEIIQKVEEIASLSGQEIDFEIPINDTVAMSFATTCGFKELKGEKESYRTLVFIKQIEKREIDGQTLSRKQGKESN